MNSRESDKHKQMLNNVKYFVFDKRTTGSSSEKEHYHTFKDLIETRCLIKILSDLNQNSLTVINYLKDKLNYLENEFENYESDKSN